MVLVFLDTKANFNGKKILHFSHYKGIFIRTRDDPLKRSGICSTVSDIWSNCEVIYNSNTVVI